jgi:hypothetical protein
MTWAMGAAITAIGIFAGVFCGLTLAVLIGEDWAVPAAIAASTLAVVLLFHAGGWLA